MEHVTANEDSNFVLTPNGKFRIHRTHLAASGLTLEAAEAEAEFIDEMNSRSDEENDALYDGILRSHYPDNFSEGGFWLSTDIAREMFDQYAYDPAAYSNSTSVAARAYIENRLERLIGDKRIFAYRFLAGGQASGKSSTGISAEKGMLVFDSVFGNWEKATDWLTRAKDTGAVVRLDYVWNPVEQSVVREYVRRQEEGRRVRPESMAQGHFGAQDVIIKLLELADTDFKGVLIRVWDNSGKQGKNHLAGFALGEDLSLVSEKKIREKTLAFLRGVRYTSLDEAAKRLNTARKTLPPNDASRTGRADAGAMASELFPHSGEAQGEGSATGSDGTATSLSTGVPDYGDADFNAWLAGETKAAREEMARDARDRAIIRQMGKRSDTGTSAPLSLRTLCHRTP
jgi:hypothetical protein